ncbi:class I adenylate-forming enzyme family protein [Gephyromycinifex aptenodytis]|uniref:class I adenylate-forming enzyme family protein n=1 Tax=Gephyromycinifex aptenodytis TaxID=2716227 RepID=UPI001447032D|nr:class I adenylate-forming enzyme family protein [Gephyromycinifex aptenodytis]
MRLPIVESSDPDTVSGAERDQAIARRISIGDVPTRSAATYQERLAIVGPTRSLTYLQLEEEANRLAHGLMALGIQSREPVAIMAPNCPEIVAGYLGVAKMGGAALLINLLGGAENIVKALRGAGARVLIVHEGLLPLLGLIAAQISDSVESVIVIGSHPEGEPALANARYWSWSDFQRYADNTPGVDPASPPDVVIADRQIAQIMFSSGTSADPKGVLTSHVAVTIAMHANAATLGLNWGGQPSVSTLVLPLFHTTAMNAIMLPMLAMGGTVHVLPGFDVESLGRTIVESQTTHFVGLPIMIEGLLNWAHAHGHGLEHLTSLLYGMAPMKEGLRALVAQRLPHARIMLGSGMTEALPAGFMHWPDIAEEKRASWGYTTAFATTAVVEPGTGDQLPTGQQGELVYRGPGVMENYLVPDPSVFTGGWLHSLDIGSFDEDGIFWFVDRIKDIVKAGGENVSTQAVESVLLDHPDIAEVAVIGKQDEQWGERVVAVVVPTPVVAADPTKHAELIASIDEYGREHLSSSYRPREIIVAQELPRTGTGKLRKADLRDTLRDVEGYRPSARA